MSTKYAFRVTHSGKVKYYRLEDMRLTRVSEDDVPLAVLASILKKISAAAVHLETPSEQCADLARSVAKVETLAKKVTKKKAAPKKKASAQKKPPSKKKTPTKKKAPPKKTAKKKGASKKPEHKTKGCGCG